MANPSVFTAASSADCGPSFRPRYWDWHESNPQASGRAFESRLVAASRNPLSISQNQQKLANRLATLQIAMSLSSLSQRIGPLHSEPQAAIHDGIQNIRRAR